MSSRDAHPTGNNEQVQHATEPLISVTTHQAPSVFIVGAGPSGLVALKEMLEAGCDVTCVDAKPNIGGVFSVAYDELFLTTTNLFMAFSDYPPKDEIKYWSKSEYLAYLEDYVDHFGLRKHIKLNTAVTNATLKDGKWEICTKDWSSKKGEMRRGSSRYYNDTGDVSDAEHGKDDGRQPKFHKSATGSLIGNYTTDYLIVATGTNQLPKYPDLPNCTAKIIHSADFHTAPEAGCEGKRVLVIGTGESAADVAAQATDCAVKVTMWSRRDFDLAPRFISNFLRDGAYNEREVLRKQSDKQEGRTLTPHDFLEGITNSRIGSKLPTAIFSLLLDAMLSDVTKAHGQESTAGVMAAIDKKYFAKDPYHFDTAAPTKSGGVLAHAIAHCGLDILISPTVEFTGDGKTAHFEKLSFVGKAPEEVDQIDVEVDLVILCTGYVLDFSWLHIADGEDGEVQPNPRTWFKHCFPPGLGGKLAFLGYSRPAQGGIPQCSEMLARYIGLLVRGQRTLPTDYAEQAMNEGKRESEIFYLTPRATSLMDFASFTSSLARLIGCEPRIPLRPSRFVKYWTLPLWTCFYRLNGPGAKPDTCWAVCDKFGMFDALVPMPLLAVYILYSMFMQFFMLIDYLLSPVINCGQPASAVLPRFKNWRVGGHFFQLSGNSMRLQDVVLPSHGFLLLWMLIFASCAVPLLVLMNHPGS